MLNVLNVSSEKVNRLGNSKQSCIFVGGMHTVDIGYIRVQLLRSACGG